MPLIPIDEAEVAAEAEVDYHEFLWDGVQELKGLSSGCFPYLSQIWLFMEDINSYNLGIDLIKDLKIFSETDLLPLW